MANMNIETMKFVFYGNLNGSYQTYYRYNENGSIAKFLILNRQIQIRKNTKVMDRVIR